MISVALVVLLSPVVSWLVLGAPLTAASASHEDGTVVTETGDETVVTEAEDETVVAEGGDEAVVAEGEDETVVAEGGHEIGAQADGVRSLVVNSTADGADWDPGNGYCRTAPNNNVCTLRAAIMEGNATATNLGVAITTTAEGRITLPTDTNAMMVNSPITGRDNGAYLAVTRTMSIDLGNQLGLGAATSEQDKPNYGDFWVAGLYINAPNVVLKNISDFFATDSSIVFGPLSDGSSLTGGTNIQTENSHGNRFVVVGDGADNITISDLTVGRLTNDNETEAGNRQNGGIVIGLPKSGSATVKDLTIQDVTIDNTTGGTVCKAWDGTGCASNGIIAAGVGTGENWTVSGSKLISYPAATFALDLRAVSAKADNWKITGNYFTKIRSGTLPAEAALALPEAIDVGEITVEDNKFLNPASPADVQGTAIYWGLRPAGAGSDSTSRAVIRNNQFDGFKASGAATIYLAREDPSVPVLYNWFGPNTNAASTSDGHTSTADVILANATKANGAPHVFAPMSPTWQSGGKLQVTFEVPWGLVAENFAFAGPTVIIDVYAVSDDYTAKYVSSKSIPRPEMQYVAHTYVNVQFDPPPPGISELRFQMHSERPNEGGLQSSQFTMPITFTPRPYVPASVAIDMQAWRDVPSTADSYEEIMALGDEHKLADGAKLPLNLPVWFTYTVTNTGEADLTEVKVTDSENQAICTIDSLPAGTNNVKGCFRQSTLTANTT